MFKIYDGREQFYQWDLDRRLVVEDETIKEVHFCNRTDDCSLVCETYVEDGITVVDVPNILLQTDWKIRVYAYDGQHTKHDECYEVKGRTKPADYVYTETEVLNYNTLVERIEALENNPSTPGGGGADVDLSNYYTKEETDEAIVDYVGEGADEIGAFIKGADDLVSAIKITNTIAERKMDTSLTTSLFYYKDEINEMFGDVETALDEIIAIQEALIGGAN